MLEIRTEQYELLKEEARKRYVDRVCAYFWDEWSQECEHLENDELREMVLEGMETGESYGIVIEADVVKYLEVCLLLGVDFSDSEMHPWAQRILQNEDTDGTTKVEQLRFQLDRLLDNLATLGE